MRKFILYFFGFTLIIGCYLRFVIIEEDQIVKDPLPRKLKVQPIVEKSKYSIILDEINERNRKIKSFACDDLTVIVSSDSERFKLKGNVAYEKELKFRFKLDSILGNELDIGSDGDKFWFWSDRMNDSTLYWAKYENINKTKLKTHFNPYWISSSFGLNEIEYTSTVIDNHKDTIRIIKEKQNFQNKPISLVTIVDPSKKRIIGHSIYDENKNLVGSAEIKEFYDLNDISLPKKMIFNWTKENTFMVVSFNKPVLNTIINSNKWLMPNRKPVINMGVSSSSNVER